MNNPALLIIEEAYSTALNPELDYFAQLQPLASNGELANKITSNQVLFKLCMLVDAQEREIKALKEDRLVISQKVLELEGKNGTTSNTAKLDPTKAL